MAETHESEFVDYLVLVVKWKKVLVSLAVGLMLFSYLMVYLFVDPQYDSSAIILPTESQQNGISNLMKNIGTLPMGLGGIGTSTRAVDMDLYSTILGSRAMLEKIVMKFDLLNDYHLTSMEKAVEVLRTKIKKRVTDENAYEIIVRASSPRKSADMANYILEELNRDVVELNVAKSRDNRIFLEQRYSEMTKNLRLAEDSLQFYQENTGMLEAIEQSKLIISAYSSLEADLISKQMELAILEKTQSKESPQLESVRLQVNEYEKKLNAMKTGSEGNGVILALDSLPSAAKQYFRHFRDVEIYSKILEFLVPMYEQSRFDEQKNTPVLQVIDFPVVPEKKSYPPRFLFSLIITVVGLLIAFFYILLNENSEWKNSEKMKFIRSNIFKWK
ncbi:MAG TPA: Wzz/FepE/Etk N-terminal domain-containing protein [Bacteroidota bacterium]|nr:Wzz/FepE/Etk N-terminal domain-containing protein [Bacteroidota bacterium]